MSHVIGTTFGDRTEVVSRFSFPPLLAIRNSRGRHLPCHGPDRFVTDPEVRGEGAQALGSSEGTNRGLLLNRQPAKLMATVRRRVPNIPRHPRPPRDEGRRGWSQVGNDN